MRNSPLSSLIYATVLVLPWHQLVTADEITFLRKEKQITQQGNILATHDFGLLLQSADGKLWPIENEQIVERNKSSETVSLYSKRELADAVLEDMPANSNVLHTTNYLIAYNTSRNYAQWVGGMLERLNRGFHSFWKQRGLTLTEPDQPLVVIVLDNQKTFAKFSEDELGEAAQSIIGYYSMHTNYVVMFDLTGNLSSRGRPLGSSQINQLMARGDFQWSLATIVHEATHQLAFNSGLQKRFADVPLWFSEGLAMYFETPDMTSRRGWSGIGAVSAVRLRQFQSGTLPTQQPFLPGLLTNDDPLRQGATALDGYAQAWAVTYFLQKRYAKEYASYLKDLSKIPPLNDPSPNERVRVFQKHFGADLIELERQIRGMMANLKP